MMKIILIMAIVGIGWGKIVKGRSSFHSFQKDNCIFLMRYGSSSHRAKIEFTYRSEGKYSTSYNTPGSEESHSERMHMDVMITDYDTHMEIQRDIEDKDKRAYGYSAHLNVIAAVRVDLAQGGEVTVSRTYDSPYPSMTYYYLCDPSESVRRYSQLQDRLYNQYRDKRKGENRDTGNNGFGLDIDDIREYSDRSSSLVYTLNAYGVDGLADEVAGHHSVEDRHTGKTTLTFILAYIVLGVLLIMKVYHYYKINEQIDSPIIVLTVSVWIMLIALIFKGIHFWLNSKYGNDNEAMEVIYRLLNLAADGTVSVLFLLFTKGYGIARVDLIDEYPLEFVIGLVILCARYVWILVGYFTEYNHNTIYHFYDGVVGKLELCTTVVFFLWFIVSLKASKYFKISMFRNLGMQLTVLGCGYLLVRPLLILVAYMLSHHNQHIYAYFLTLFSHYAVCALAGYTFTNKRGVYMRVSLSNSIELAGDTRLQ